MREEFINVSRAPNPPSDDGGSTVSQVKARKVEMTTQLSFLSPTPIFLVVLGVEPRGLFMLGKYSITEPPL